MHLVYKDNVELKVTFTSCRKYDGMDLEASATYDKKNPSYTAIMETGEGNVLAIFILEKPNQLFALLHQMHMLEPFATKPSLPATQVKRYQSSICLERQCVEQMR